MTRLSPFAIALLCWFSTFTFAAEPRRPVILDAAFGSRIDDALALAILTASPEVDLRAVTTVGNDAETSAFMACRFLTAVDRRKVPVAWGRDEQPKLALDLQRQYRNHPALIFNRMAQPSKESVVELLHKQLSGEGDKITLVMLGPVTNLAKLLKEYPTDKERLEQVIVTADAGQLAADKSAATTVLAAKLPLILITDSIQTATLLDEKSREKIIATCTPLSYQLQALLQLTDQPAPRTGSLLAAAICVDDTNCKFVPRHAAYDTDGLTISTGPENAKLATRIQPNTLHAWIVKRLAAGTAVLPEPPKNVSKPVEQGRFPVRVHAYEDFETDIEARWWMSGKLETKNVPPGSTRACRGVVTEDFDDRQGNLKTMYNAVIFNPVPGPPMGPKTRLSFRYWLKGTDQIRVQLYSLTNGYHRYLSLPGLPQEKWQSATVDMTAMRRPDGSGGPLSENERIDDIQFYVDPRAELIIDDIILYEAAAEKEMRPFPSRVIFTGWFDTGKQGKEWPGQFEIVDKAGSFWKAAKSVPLGDDKTPIVNVSLRGERPIHEATHVTFRYKLTGAEKLNIALGESKRGVYHGASEVKPVKTGEWAEATVVVKHASGETDRPDPPSRVIDAIRFSTELKGELLVDDVLLYEPGK